MSSGAGFTSIHRMTVLEQKVPLANTHAAGEVTCN
jgi:hypothetical protein